MSSSFSRSPWSSRNVATVGGDRVKCFSGTDSTTDGTRDGTDGLKLDATTPIAKCLNSWGFDDISANPNDIKQLQDLLNIYNEAELRTFVSSSSEFRVRALFTRICQAAPQVPPGNWPCLGYVTSSLLFSSCRRNSRGVSLSSLSRLVVCGLIRREKNEAQETSRGNDRDEWACLRGRRTNVVGDRCGAVFI